MHADVNPEHYREKLAAVLALVRLYAHELVSHASVIILTCEAEKTEQRNSNEYLPSNLVNIASAAKKVGAVAHKLISLEAEFRDCAS